MKQEIDNNAMWAAFRQELSLQGELQVVAAIDNALNNLGFTIEETNTIIPIPLKQGEELTLKKVTKAFLESLSETPYNNMPFVQAQASAKQLLAFLTDPKSYNPDGEVGPKFKVGDSIRLKNSNAEYIIESISNGRYYCKGCSIGIICCDRDYELVDKVKPKFHEGEWVVYECGEETETLQITRIVEGTYVFSDNSTLGVVDEDTLRLWDIVKDAKDGDVLCYEDEISIYKHDIKNCTKQGITFGGFVYYCCYDGKRFIMDGFYSLTEQDKTDIHPATKEQRDLLFQKIKEAGHEWNAEKKELKHIEQWKPSGEQMKYLHKYAEQNNYDGAVLTSLYNDLKQLKQL